MVVSWSPTEATNSTDSGKAKEYSSVSPTYDYESCFKIKTIISPSLKTADLLTYLGNKQGTIMSGG